MSSRTIMCFGDSLTWGAVPKPDGPPSERYGALQRWPRLVADSLGSDTVVVEDGLRSRTTAVDDPLVPYVNGLTYLPVALRSQAPVDLVITMLGTNDTKHHLGRSIDDIAGDMSALVAHILEWDNYGKGASDVLVIAPPPLGRMIPEFEVLFDEGREKIAGIEARYARIAETFGVQFLAASDVIAEVGADGIHLSIDNNRVLADAVSAMIKDQF